MRTKKIKKNKKLKKKEEKKLAFEGYQRFSNERERESLKSLPSLSLSPFNSHIQIQLFETTMSSLSAPFLSPPAAATRRGWRRVTAAPITTAPAEVAVEEARLEARVEEREGYWVVKEKFREGINPQEKVKIEKEPMKLFMENGIEELSKLSMEEIDASKLTKDDVDVRLKWLGLFHRRKHQCEFLFDLRVNCSCSCSCSGSWSYLHKIRISL